MYSTVEFPGSDTTSWTMLRLCTVMANNCKAVPWIVGLLGLQSLGMYVCIIYGLYMCIPVYIHCTDRTVVPISPSSQTMSRASNSIRRRTSSSGGVSSAQTGGVGQGAGAPPSDRRRQRGPRQISHRECGWEHNCRYCCTCTVCLYVCLSVTPEVTELANCE